MNDSLRSIEKQLIKEKGVYAGLKASRGETLNTSQSCQACIAQAHDDDLKMLLRLYNRVVQAS